MLFIELLMFILTIYGVLVIRKKVSSFIGNGDLLGTTNPLPKKWWTTTTSRGAASFLLRDEGYLDYMVVLKVFNEVDINYTAHTTTVHVHIVVPFFIRLCYFLPEGLPYINIFARFKVAAMCMITVLQYCLNMI